MTQAAPPVSQPGAWGPAVIHKADDGADAAASAEDARLAAAQAAAAEKAKRLKQARYQKRKEQEQLARQRDDQQYSAALGYEQEPIADSGVRPVRAAPLLKARYDAVVSCAAISSGSKT